MKFVAEIDNKYLERIFGKSINQEEFNRFCSDAITSRLFEEQFRPKEKQKIQEMRDEKNIKL